MFKGSLKEFLFDTLQDGFIVAPKSFKKWHPEVFEAWNEFHDGCELITEFSDEVEDDVVHCTTQHLDSEYEEFIENNQYA